MDYEKAYKAVLETATKWIKDGCTDKEKICLESVFPELRESEDERIRREIIDFICQKIDRGSVTKEQREKSNSWLAWLEKQKEPNAELMEKFNKGLEQAIMWGREGCKVSPNGEVKILNQDEIDDVIKKQKESLHIQETCKENADSFTDEDERIRKWLVDYFKAVERCWIHWDISPERIVSYLERRKEPENVNATTIAPSCWEVEQKEQKPPIAGNDFGWIDELKHDLEHPEELDQKVDDVLKQRKGTRALEWSDTDNIGWDEAFACVTRAEKAAKNEEELQNAVTAEKWLKEIKFKYCIYPVKQEWSEEDEHRRTDAIYFLESAKSHYADTSEIEKTILWLKSLRPSWKPIEEQMNALRSAVNKLAKTDVADSVRLSIMYDNLKKLM